MSIVFFKNPKKIFLTSAKIHINHTLLTKCQVGCSHKELSLIFTFISAKTDILLDGIFQFLGANADIFLGNTYAGMLEQGSD